MVLSKNPTLTMMRAIQCYLCICFDLSVGQITKKLWINMNKILTDVRIWFRIMQNNSTMDKNGQHLHG